MSQAERPWSIALLSGSARVTTEAHETVVADDGTRLFLRTMPARSPDTSRLRAFFCDGIACEGFIWKYLWNDLASHCDVAHWHYRGHGRSGAPADPDKVDIAQHARDLMAVRRHVGDPPCVLVGHSMGTQVCLETWRLFPEQVKGIVLVCGSYGKVTQSFRGVPILDAILPKLMSAVEKQPHLARAIWSRLPREMAFRAAMLAGDLDPDNVRREDIWPYLEHVTHVDLAMFLKTLRSAGEHSAEEYLAQIDVPVLIVAGERDTFTPASLSRYMAEQIPGSELLMIPNGTHVAVLEQPELVRARIREFVERVSAS